jgi:hypothetical protein
MKFRDYEGTTLLGKDLPKDPLLLDQTLFEMRELARNHKLRIVLGPSDLVKPMRERMADDEDFDMALIGLRDIARSARIVQIADTLVCLDKDDVDAATKIIVLKSRGDRFDAEFHVKG